MLEAWNLFHSSATKLGNCSHIINMQHTQKHAGTHGTHPFVLLAWLPLGRLKSPPPETENDLYFVDDHPEFDFPIITTSDVSSRWHFIITTTSAVVIVVLQGISLMLPLVPVSVVTKFGYETSS